MSDVQIAVIDEQDTQIVLAVPGVQGATGSTLPSGGTADQVLRKNSSTDYDYSWTQVTSAMIADGAIVNADVNASAAIAGTKIAPNFGSQTVQTTGVFSAALGTAGAPTLTFTGDTNTGIYSPGADQVAISTGGTGRLFVDANGVITNSSTSYLAGSGENTFFSASNYRGLTLNTDTSAHRPTLSFRNASGAGALAYIQGDGQALAFGRAGQDYGGHQESLRITSDGNVGIGTSTPGAKLVVDGGTSGDQFRLGTDPHYYKIGRNSTSGPLEFYGTQSGVTGYVFGGVDGTRLTIDSSGRVGIGTTSPGFLLDLFGTTPALRIKANGVGNGVKLEQSSATGDVELNVIDTYPLIFKNANTERCRLDTSGRLLVGTSSSTANTRLVVQGNTAGGTYQAGVVDLRVNGANPPASYTLGEINFRDNGDARGALIKGETDGDWASNDYPGRLVFSTTADGASSPTERLRITSDGKVGIGTSSPASLLHVDSSPAGTQSARTLLSSSNDADTVACEIRQGRYNKDVLVVSSNQSLSANLFNAIENGTSRFVITGTGSVGIGTTSPSELIHGRSSGDAKLFLQNTTGNSTGVALQNDGQGSAGLLYDRSANTFKLYGPNVDITYANASQAITFNRGVNESARIDSSGRLLVGTSTARSNLETSITPGFQIEGLANNSNRYVGFIYNSADAGGPEIHFAKSRGTAIGSNTVVASGDQIGTVNFEGADGTNFFVGAQIRAFVDGTPGTNDMPGRLVFSTTKDGQATPTEACRINSSQQLLIGTQSVSIGTQLEVANATGSAAAFVVSAQPDYAIFCHNKAISGDNNFISFGTEASFTTRGSVTYNRTGGVVAYNTTSDYRAKTILGGLENSGATIDALKVYRGVMNGATVERPMLIAHEAQEVAPYCVTGEKDAVDDEGSPVYQQMDHQVLVPLLIAEIQQLRARVAALESA